MNALSFEEVAEWCEQQDRLFDVWDNDSCFLTGAARDNGWPSDFIVGAFKGPSANQVCPGIRDFYKSEYFDNNMCNSDWNGGVSGNHIAKQLRAYLTR